MDFFILLPSVVLAVLGYLLKQRDEKQEDEIQRLFFLHDDDAKKLVSLQLEIAKNHYEKAELDPKFIRLELAISEGLHKVNTDLGLKLDKLADILQAHLICERRDI